ncbi:Dabb family protein [Nocardioides sp. TRM66260-LWL]|uniref:Dabb family protein n=1 Tax=Nocardioides sp. TRM66260-LWL TaxID=2874478 RepID=UPI001CC676F4|nr:Dabb family protein [Nocardioides sp. TRM66260-LWL]MBZ5736519.1 Dabb family protein [Nocardioides sp. TRM66260-LWL]
MTGPAIRNIVVGVLRDDATPEQAETALAALRGLRVEGVSYELRTGLDVGLRDGNASYALTADFASEDDYRVYDLDEEHNRIRRELFAPISASIQRIQIRL